MADMHLSNVTGTLDIDSMVQGLLQPKLQDIQKLQTQKATLQAKASSISNLLGALKEAQSNIEGWDIDSIFTGKKVDVEDTSILSASASSETPNVSLKINVLQLPQTEIRVSTSGVSDLEDTISAQTFTLKYWTSDSDYETFTINFSGGTLEDLVDTINSSQDKVEASIYYDGTYYKLMLSEKDAGASTKETSDTTAVIEVDTLPSELGSLETIQNAQNAKIQIGDSTDETISPTNTFENVISGLNITVSQTGETSLTIEDDYSGVSSTVEDFLEKINQVIDLVNSNTEKGALFQGNAMITQIKSQFFTLMQPLIKLGVINIDDEGKYSVDSSTLQSLAESNTEEVKEALKNIKENFSSALEQLVDSFEVYKNTQDNQIDYLDEEIKKTQEALSKEEEKLRLEFAKIEALMYQNDQLKERLKNFAIPLSEAVKK
jgi:flagellar hook-associated protein 2